MVTLEETTSPGRFKRIDRLLLREDGLTRTGDIVLGDKHLVTEHSPEEIYVYNEEGIRPHVNKDDKVTDNNIPIIIEISGNPTILLEFGSGLESEAGLDISNVVFWGKDKFSINIISSNIAISFLVSVLKSYVFGIMEVIVISVSDIFGFIEFI